MTQAATKDNLHPRNLHRGRYNFVQLIASSPELAVFVARTNTATSQSISPIPLPLKHSIARCCCTTTHQELDIPAQYLCPPIPGRADYIHYLADLLSESNGGEIPRGKSVRALDIGVGANCIYPLIGHAAYGWQFVGTDVDATALHNAQQILDANQLNDAIELRLQKIILSDIFRRDLRG